MNRKYTLLLVISVLFISQCIKAQTTNYAAYSLFVASFSKYASWPQTGNDFKITVLGKSKIYDELMKITANKNVNGLVYKITQVENVNEIGDTQILFIPDNKSSNLDDVVKATSGKPVMIVTEREGLLKKGADFSFLIIDNKLKFDVNASNLEKRNIKVSSNLVSIANSSM
jgi:hypothetical protein